jgi:hypothetical protein
MRLDVDRYGRGTNGTRVSIGPVTIWFSYHTPIAVAWTDEQGKRQVATRRNSRGPTTGRHLAEVDRQAHITQPGLDSSTFAATLDAALGTLHLYLAPREDGGRWTQDSGGAVWVPDAKRKDSG